MSPNKFWIIKETISDDNYYYTGYYKTGKPVFNMAIAEAVQIASLGNAKMIFDVLSEIVPCEILLVANNTVTKVFPE